MAGCDNAFKMTATATELMEQALGLPESERADLAHHLLLSLEEEQGVEKAWEQEIARRVERVNNGTAKGRPAEDVLRDLRARLQ